MDKELEKAMQFAEKAHRRQRYGDAPYIVHLVDTAAVAASYGLSKTVIAACWLHDVLEDTPVTLEQLQHEFGYEIAEIVRRVSDEPGKNRKERKAKTYPKTAANPDAVLVKLCDRIANIDACLRSENPMLKMYRDENKEFFAGLEILERGGVFFTMGMLILNKLNENNGR